MVHSEVGVWRLVEARARDDKGNVIPSQFGPTPLGIVTFDGRRMIAALGDARDAVPEAEQPREYNSYAGPYTFDGTRLVTRVDCTSRPDRMGTDQVRGVRFEEGGRFMVLTPPPRMIRGVMHHPELRWERMG